MMKISSKSHFCFSRLTVYLCGEATDLVDEISAQWWGNKYHEMYFMTAGVISGEDLRKEITTLRYEMLSQMRRYERQQDDIRGQVKAIERDLTGTGRACEEILERLKKIDEHTKNLPAPSPFHTLPAPSSAPAPGPMRVPSPRPWETSPQRSTSPRPFEPSPQRSTSPRPFESSPQRSASPRLWEPSPQRAPSPRPDKISTTSIPQEPGKVGQLRPYGYNSRADSRLAPSQWEMALQSNAVSHWLGANLESALW